MRILFHHRIRSKDGQFVHLEELTRALRADGHELLIVGPQAIESEEFGAEAGLVDILKKFLPGFLYELLELTYSVPAYLRLRRAISTFRPDAIYERYQLFFPAGIVAARQCGLPLVLEVNAPLYEERARHSGIALHRLARWSERYVWNRADRTLPVTQVLADKVRQAGVPPERIEVVANGIDFSRFDGLPARDAAKAMAGVAGKTVLGFVGFIRDWHGLDRVVRFVAESGRPDLHLLMVGDGPERENLLRLAATLGIGGQVTATGIVPRDEVGRWLAAFDVALQPDVTEYASPLKLFEYMYVGLPVVAPDVPNIREVLAHEGNALLFDRDRQSAFEEAIRRYLADPALRDRLGAAARATILERDMTWQGNARRVVRMFERLLQRDAVTEEA